MSSPSANRSRLPRKDCFFGLHFDLHPGKQDTVLGADVTDEMVAELLDRVHPDFIQYDCKGHAGYTGYPTKVGYASPGIVKDSLAIWRKVTAERGVGLYIHYSGVWDDVALEHHPEWGRVDENGKLDPSHTGTFGPYVDELMIPQLKEVTAAYDLDGMWVDGECWGAQLDYSPAALEQWTRETGFQDAPKGRSEPQWLAWKMFNRRQFEKYLRHWVDALHAFNPTLQITSNWAYTTFVPKPIVAKLDYISGDFTPMMSVDRARTEARYLANTAMPWDLMAWGFNWTGATSHSLKPAVHLEQEASVVLMQGGGFQIYYNPTRSGYVCDEIVDITGQVSGFCRARQSVSHRSVSIPQVAVLLSSETLWDRMDSVYTPFGMYDELEGALHGLLESHYSVDVLAEHQLQPRLSEFPLVVIPDCYKLTDEFRSALLAYVGNGGSLFLMGEKCARLFTPELGVDLVGEPANVAAELKAPMGVVNENGVWQSVKLTAAEPIAYRYPTRDTRTGGEVAATVMKYGKGKIAAVYGPIAGNFFATHHPFLRSFIGDVAHRLFPEPAVTIDGPPCIDIALRRTNDGKLSIHLLNRANVPNSDQYGAIDFVPPVGPIRVQMKVAEQPKSVEWIPDGGHLKWSWADGTLSATIPSVHVHGVVVVDM